jgi:hypothetical protein
LYIKVNSQRKVFFSIKFPPCRILADVLFYLEKSWRLERRRRDSALQPPGGFPAASVLDNDGHSNNANAAFHGISMTTNKPIQKPVQLLLSW